MDNQEIFRKPVTYGEECQLSIAGGEECSPAVHGFALDAKGSRIESSRGTC